MILQPSQATARENKLRVPHQSCAVLHLWDASEMRLQWPRSAAKPQPRRRCFWCKVGGGHAHCEKLRAAADSSWSTYNLTWPDVTGLRLSQNQEAAVANLRANRPVLIQVLSELNNRSLFSGDMCQLSPLPPIRGSASIGELLESPAVRKVSLSTHFTSYNRSAPANHKL